MTDLQIDGQASLAAFGLSPENLTQRTEIAGKVMGIREDSRMALDLALQQYLMDMTRTIWVIPHMENGTRRYVVLAEGLP